MVLPASNRKYQASPERGPETMDSFDPMLAHAFSTVAGALVTSIWEGTLLAAVVAMCMRFLPGMTAAARSRIWGVVFVIAVLLPLGGLIHAGPVRGPATPSG